MRGQLKGEPLTNVQIKEYIAEELCDRLKGEFDLVENVKEYAKNSNDFIVNFILVDVIEKTNVKLQVKPDYTVEEFRYAPHKFKRCEICGALFYDATRNGRQSVCKTKISYQYSNKLGKYVPYSRDGRTVFDCERIRENIRKSGEVSVGSYAPSTLERKERELFVWTSFNGDTPAEQYKIDSMMASTQGYGINGRRNGFVVNKTEN